MLAQAAVGDFAADLGAARGERYLAPHAFLSSCQSLARALSRALLPTVHVGSSFVPLALRMAMFHGYRTIVADASGHVSCCLLLRSCRRGFWLARVGGTPSACQGAVLDRYLSALGFHAVAFVDEPSGEHIPCLLGARLLEVIRGVQSVTVAGVVKDRRFVIANAGFHIDGWRRKILHSPGQCSHPRLIVCRIQKGV